MHCFVECSRFLYYYRPGMTSPWTGWFSRASSKEEGGRNHTEGLTRRHGRGYGFIKRGPTRLLPLFSMTQPAAHVSPSILIT